MEKRAVRWWMALLLAAVSNELAHGDLFHHMEDAFADEADLKGNGRSLLFCRVGNLQESALDKLDPSLCTLLIGEEVTVRPGLQQIPFLVSEPIARLQNRERKEALIEWLQEGNVAGLDITMGPKMLERQEVLDHLQDLGGLMSGFADKLLSLTFINAIPDASFLEQLLSTVEVNSFSFFVDSTTDAESREQQMTAISKLSIPKDKVLYGIKLPHHGTEGSSLLQMCSEIPQRSAEEIQSQLKSGEGTGGIKRLQEEVLQVVEQSKAAGIQVWSLDGDDTEGACGKGSYPILRYIRNYGLQVQQKYSKPFGKFADLDITLSTGESEEVEFIQDLDAKQELKKLPCERVGFYRHPSDCTRFYHCSKHRITKFNHSGPYAGDLYRCPKGLVYDEKQSSCIWPSMSDPCKGSGELLPVLDQKFACITPGFHADPDNCRWFYYCSDLGDGQLEAFEFLCPSDLLGFDEKKLLCNWKWTVPACSNYGKRPESSTEAVYTSTNTGQNRRGKELHLQGVSLLTTTTTKRPQSSLPSSQENESKNETILSAVNTSVSILEENLNFLTTTDDKPNEVSTKVQNVFREGEKFTSQQNLPQNKYGTAVWRRSWLTNVTDQRNRVQNPREDQKFKDSNSYNQNNTENGGVNQNSSGIPNGFEPLPKQDERKRIFRGRVRKISLKSNQSNEHGSDRSKNKVGTTRAIQEQLPKIRAQTNDNENNILFSSHNKEVNEHEEISLPEVQPKSSPYINVRCSKPENENGRDRDANTFGCTSEVSLTIHIPRGKDPSRYILKEDRISKTAYQESQKISHLQNIADKARTADVNLEHKTGSIPSLIFSRNEVPLMRMFDTTKISEIKVTTEPSRPSELTNDLDFDLQASFLTKSPENYEVKQPHNIGYTVSEHFSPKAEKLRDDSRRNMNKRVKYEQPREYSNSARSMPVHFYPPGVLLNIDLTHVSEIPPQILLEVDNMLRKYMDEGDIDVSLLERKLNVTAVSAEEDKDKKDPMEIMEVIKAIENMLNVSKEEELNDQTNGDEELGMADLLYTKEIERENVTVPTQGNSSEYEKITTPTKNISLELENVTPLESISGNNDSLYHTKISQSDNKQRNPLISDKIQDSESPDGISINISNQKPFGRQRLFRKFRYPSIREQLQKQMQRQNLQKDENASEVSDLDIKRLSSSTYTYPLSRNRAVLTLPNVSVATDDTYSKQSGNISLPEHTYNAVKTSALPYGFELKMVGNHSDLFNNQNEEILSRSVIPHYDSTRKWAILETAYAARSSGTSSDADYPRLQTDIETVVKLERESYVNSSAKQLLLDETRKPYDQKNPIVRYGDVDETGKLYDQKSPSFRYGDKTSSTFEDRRNNGRSISAYSPDFVELSRSREEDAYMAGILQENAANLDKIDNYDLRENGKNPENYDINSYGEHRETKNSFPSNSQDYAAKLNRRRTDGPQGSISTRPEEQKLDIDNIRLDPINEGRKRRNFTQRRGKKKLRVLVRKVVNNQTSPRQNVIPPSNDENGMQERIPDSNILRVLKDKILQRHSKDSIHDIELQIRYIDHVWNIPFVNEKSKTTLSPAVCTRAGLFQHPTDCNTFYECFWDKWLQKFTLHVFSCPVKLVYDTNVRGCGRPSADSPCANYAK